MSVESRPFVEIHGESFDSDLTQQVFLRTAAGRSPNFPL